MSNPGDSVAMSERLQMGRILMKSRLGPYEGTVERALKELEGQNVLSRMWEHDHTIWSSDPTEISNRLGWLQSPEVMQENLPKIYDLVSTLRAEGYKYAVLLGMGGSSLAPDLFRKTFGLKGSYLDLFILDSTDPRSVREIDKLVELERTIFIVATKSGGTVETLSFFKYFYNKVVEVVGESHAGSHFIAITDPGSKLEDLAHQYNFRQMFLNDPNIGGRYSALSYFGLVPAGLIGMDLDELLYRARKASAAIGPTVQGTDNPALWLGAIMGELAQVGRDKLTLITSPQLSSFGDWIEQLIAESTGKEGKGILPVVDEPLGELDLYRDDRLFVYMHLEGDNDLDSVMKGFEDAGHPVVHIIIDDRYDLGGQFFIWEMATAIASQRLGINPFDQPNVEAAKVLAREKVQEFEELGGLPHERASISGEGIEIYLSSGDGKAGLESASPGEAINGFLASHNGNGYVTLQAYVHPSQDIDVALRNLRRKIMEKNRLATTSGYGPRFLHSTGQLHKGDAGNGLFIQITSDDPDDISIPVEAGSEDSTISFGILKAAQAQGDREALIHAGRRVLRIHLGGDVLIGLDKILKWIS
jgi:glucose-6-phosphate isomerase